MADFACLTKLLRIWLDYSEMTFIACINSHKSIEVKGTCEKISLGMSNWLINWYRYKQIQS